MPKAREILRLGVRLPGGLQRVETGPVQFNDDWPGTFIRGDNAHFYAEALATAIRCLEQKAPDDFITIAALKGLMIDLRASNLNKTT